LDGDGKADVVLSHASSSTGGLAVFWGTGPATFNTNGQVVTAVKSPGRVQLADLDGDGRPELIVTDLSGGSQPGQLAIVKFTGQTADPPVLVRTGSIPDTYHGDVLVADVNGDWVPDLIVHADYQGLTEIDVIAGLGGALEFDLPLVYRFGGSVNSMTFGRASCREGV